MKQLNSFGVQGVEEASSYLELCLPFDFAPSTSLRVQQETGARSANEIIAAGDSPRIENDASTDERRVAVLH